MFVNIDFKKLIAAYEDTFGKEETRNSIYNHPTYIFCYYFDEIHSIYQKHLGVYETDLNSHELLELIYEVKDTDCYGLAGSIYNVVNLPQVIKYKKNLSKNYIFTFTIINKENNPTFRFSKWGKYYGENEIDTEYLGNSKNFDYVIVWEVLEIELKGK